MTIHTDLALLSQPNNSASFIRVLDWTINYMVTLVIKISKTFLNEGKAYSVNLICNQEPTGEEREIIKI